MTQQLEIFEPAETSRDDTSTKQGEIVPMRGNCVPGDFAEDLGAATERVRDGLQKMSAKLFEVAREIETVKGCLTRAQFRSWVSLACGLSPRVARSIMRAAELAPSAPVHPQFERSAKLTPCVLKDMIRAVKARTAASSQTVTRPARSSTRHARITNSVDFSGTL